MPAAIQHRPHAKGFDQSAGGKKGCPERPGAQAVPGPEGPGPSLRPVDRRLDQQPLIDEQDPVAETRKREGGNRGPEPRRDPACNEPGADDRKAAQESALENDRLPAS